jgi:hypothetical protein
MPNTVTMTREELYVLIWAELLSIVAKRYHHSDRAFRQLCVRLSIPIPREHHWNRIRSGEIIERPPLPAIHRGEQSVELRSKEGKRLQSSSLGIANAAKEPTGGRRLDPLLEAVKQTLTAKENTYLRDGLRHSDSGQLDIRVSAPNVDRALRFMNQLLHAVRGRGYHIEGHHVLVNGQKMGICCREKLKRVAVTRHSWQRTELAPTGILAFQLVPEWAWQTREWKEGAETLEEKIPAILEKMESEGLRLIEEERERKIRQAERAEEDRIRREQEQKKQAELAGFQALFTQATRWRRTMDLRGYLDAFEAHARAADILTNDRQAWLTWARAKADWYDPFLESADEWLAHINRNTLK